MALLSDLANAALAKTLPAFDGWLRARLGDKARIDSAKMEGTRLAVEGAHLPLGPRMHIEVERATLAVVARTLKSPRIYVSTAKGKLEVRGAGRTLTAELELSRGRDESELWLAGPVRVTGDTTGELVVEISKSQWKLSGELEDAGGKFRVRANGPLGGGRQPVSELRLDVHDALVERVMHHAVAWLDTEPPPFEIADGARGTGELRWQNGHLTSSSSWEALRIIDRELPDPVTLKTDLRFAPNEANVRGGAEITSVGSALTIEPLTWRAGRFEATTIRGHVSMDDLRRAGIFDGPLTPTTRGQASIDLTLDGGEDWTIEGKVTTEQLELERSDRAGTPVFTLAGADLDLRLDRERLTVPRFSLTGYGTKLEGDAENAHAGETKRPLMVLSFVDANADFACALASLSENVRVEIAQDGVRPLGARWIAEDLKLSGRVSLDATHEVRGEIAVQTADTALMIPITFADGKLDGTQLRGRVATADALGLGFLDGPIAPRPKGSWNVSAEIYGAPDAPGLRARVESAACDLNLWGLIDLSLSDLEARVHVDQEAVIWKDARAKGYGGHARCEGVMGFTDAFRGLDCDLSCDGVAIGDLSLPTGPIRDHVTGELTAELHLRKLDSGAISGQGRVTLDEPSYPVIAHAKKQLLDVALPVPPPEGVTPLTCGLTLTDDAAKLSDLQAEVDGISLRAGGTIGYDGAIDGGASARLRGAFLRKSPLFVIPATIGGGITVPIHIGGTLAQPALTANVSQALRDKLHTKEIAGAVTSAFDGIRDAADGAASAIDDFISNIGGTPKPAPSARPVEDAELEALVDRCMKGGPSTDELIDRLIEAGVTSDDIVRILEKRRMRF